MATAVCADPESQSMQALKYRFQKAWKSTSLSTIQNLIGLMPNKLIAVSENKEDTIPCLPWCSGHGQRPRSALMFIGPLLCNFNGGVI